MGVRDRATIDRSAHMARGSPGRVRRACGWWGHASGASHQTGPSATVSPTRVAALRSFGRGSILAGACALLGLSSVAGAEETTGARVAQVCAPLVTSPSSGADTAASPDEPDVATGRWRRMARAPFGIDTDLAAWTGTRMIVTRWDDGRSAAYDPRRDRWREIAKAPRGVDSVAVSIWTGSEFIIIEVNDDGPGLRGLAYDPKADRWRKVEPHPAEADGEDHAIGLPVWTGTHVIVLDALGSISAYDPAGDCWVERPTMPGDDLAWAMYQVGPHLLIESRDQVGGIVSMRTFDLKTQTWSDPVPGPLDVDAVRNGGTVIDGRVIYISWTETDDDDVGAWDAVFDASTMSWSTFSHACETRAFGRTTVVGNVLVANDGHQALDSGTFECIDLPPPPRKFNGTEVMVWTGSELIVWSGIRSLPEPLRRGGFVYTASR